MMPPPCKADVGAAVHNAREISLDAADVLLTRSELKGISELVRLSRISRRTILQNLSLSLGYNTLTIPLAMMGWINPLLAAAAMAAMPSSEPFNPPFNNSPIRLTGTP